MHIFSVFYEGKLDVQRLGYGIIILLLKLPDANKIKKYRHFCLLKCMYKWITKTMDTRAQPS